jgi:hypothetical protein
MSLKNAFLLSLFVGVIGCHGVGTPSAKNPSAPPLKPTPECLLAKAEINRLLKPNPDFFGAFEIFLADETCALSISIDVPRSRLPIAQKIKATFGEESSLPIGETKIPLWFSEPATMWVPVLDPKTMKPLSNQETFEECQQSAQWLQISFPNATSSPRKMTRPRSQERFCYVDLAFNTESEFDDFLSWSNPYSFDGSLFFIHFRRPTGVIATVSIYAHEE